MVQGYDPRPHAEVLAGVPDDVTPAIGRENAIELNRLTRVADADLNAARTRELVRQAIPEATVELIADRGEVVYVPREACVDWLTPAAWIQ